jgi:hypothetical protein
VTADDIERAAIVIVNDAPVASLTAERLVAFVKRGGGLLVALGGRAAWPGNPADLLAAAPGAPVDRTRGASARLGALDYGHAVFEPFRAPRSGDFSGARFYGYRAVTPAADARIIARFDDGAPALVERRVGDGRVLVWTSTFDLEWNDLALKPVFLPFVHRMALSLAAYAERPSWVTVGEVLDPADRAAGAAGRRQEPRVVLTPSGQRVTLDGEGPDVLELAEHGFYEVRAAGRDAAPVITVAANVDLDESDLTPMDPQDVAAAATGTAAGAVAAAGANAVVSDDEQERAQRIWWYLLFGGVVLLGFETLLANRISRA